MRVEPSTGRTSSPSRRKEPRWQAFLRQYRDPMQIVLLAAGVLSLFLPGQVATGVVLIGLTLLNAAMGLNQEGKANASVAALQKMMVVSAKVRRDGSLVQLPMEQLVPGRHRQHRGRRPRPGRRAHPHLGHPRDRRVRADRRERPGPQAGRGRRRGRRARRPGRPGVHEHPGDARRGHDPGDQHRHVDRGRPHQRHAQRDEGRGHAADPPAQRVDQPDPGHRRCRAADLDRHRPVAEHPDRRAVPDRDRVRRVGHPDRSAGGGHGDPVEGDDDARRRPAPSSSGCGRSRRSARPRRSTPTRPAR